MKTKINLGLQTLILALACGILSQAPAVAFAQESQPALAGADSGLAQTTKSGGADGKGSPNSWSPALTGERNPLYRLHKSDVLDIKFAFEPEFDQVVSVLPDGFIALKGLDEIYVEGMRVPEVSQAIRNAYLPVLRDPEINIFLRDFERPYFIAGGEVGRPGKYDLRAEITLTEAVALAGGFTERSKHSQVVLFRRVTSEIVESHLLNVKSMLKSRNLGEDIQIMPGDFVFVPQNTISKIKRFLPTSDMSLYSAPAKF
ncbi:MAG: polysaccharide biosynthesis/export family protein [Terriglobales bacterium]